MTTDKTPSDALAQLRHLYQNMVNGGVRDAASAKRIAQGLLSPAIAALERCQPAGAPWRSAVLDLIDDCPGLTMEQDQWLSRRVKELDFASTPQPTQAQAGAVPLTDEWIRSRCKESWIFDTAKQWVRMAEAAHGITKEGGQP